VNILKIFKKIGAFVGRAFGLAQDNGLDDKTLEYAVELARRAAALFVNNAERREWVVKALMAVGVKESIARLAVELAVQVIKRNG
jgi:hypothetical protein